MDTKDFSEVSLSPCVKSFVEWLREEAQRLASVEAQTVSQPELVVAGKSKVVLKTQLALCG